MLPIVNGEAMSSIVSSAPSILRLQYIDYYIARLPLALTLAQFARHLLILTKACNCRMAGYIAIYAVESNSSER